MHDGSVHAVKNIELFPRQPYPGRGDSIDMKNDRLKAGY